MNKSNILYNDSTGGHKLLNNLKNYNNNPIIKRINDYNLNLIKKSRYFSKTKYINGIKNKIKNSQRHINKSLSTKNISLENTRSTSHKTFNDVIVEKILNKKKKIDEYNKRLLNKETNTPKKTEDIGIETDSIRPNNAMFYDFIPLILQHMKQKETIDEINKEHDNHWLYDKINNIYNNNSSEFTKNSSFKFKNKNNLLENPIIKYLFLEKTLYNLRHTVQFIDIKNREELEQKVLKVMGEEYAKLEKKQSIYDIHDFVTYGYEFDPKFFVILKQLIRENEIINLIDYDKINKGKQKIIVDSKLTTTSFNKNKGNFFTTNKSEFKTDEDNNNDYKNDNKNNIKIDNKNNIKINEHNNNELNEKSSGDLGGLLGKIMNQTNIPNKIRKF